MSDLWTDWYVIQGINPEPWTSPEVQLMWKGKKPIIQVHKRAQVRFYQDAVRDEILRLYPEVKHTEGSLELSFLFWRNVAEAEVDDRRRWANYADATNLQKSTEDALQGILFSNDRQVQHVTSIIVEQGPDVDPRVLVALRPFTPPDPISYEWANRIIESAPTPSRREAVTDDNYF